MGGSGGAMVLGKLPVLGHQGPTVLPVGVGWGCLVIFSTIFSIISVFFLPLSGRWPNID